MVSSLTFQSARSLELEEKNKKIFAQSNTIRPWGLVTPRQLFLVEHNFQFDN